MRLREISPETYVREVLPLTAPLWAGGRTFDEYATQTLEIALGPYGRRHYRTIGLYDGSARVASFKRYERAVRDGPHRLRAVGYGAVFTPPEYRGRGYATAMLAMALDEARKEQWGLAFLFSDIRPQFYAALGFRALPSRRFLLRADALPATRLSIARLSDDDWDGVRHVFELAERPRRTGFLRSSTTWNWIRTRIRQSSKNAKGLETNLVLRRGRGTAAYVLGARDPRRDLYILDEFGFADDAAAAAIPALLRAAAGDLRRIGGWLPPDDARALLPRAAVRKRNRSIFMMTALCSQGERLLNAISTVSAGDFCWSTDHI
jgi:GNAT superfamily N-acetyltransferase